MQSKRKGKSRIRAAKRTAGYGSKKKHRGSGNRGGVGMSAQGKRSSAKLMKVTGGNNKYLGRYGFRSLNKKVVAINLQNIRESLASLVEKGDAVKSGDSYTIDLGKLGYTKLLSKGIVNIKLNLIVKKATEKATEKIVAAGGSIMPPSAK
jgi:large subunit ribosomal protein L15